MLLKSWSNRPVVGFRRQIGFPIGRCRFFFFSFIALCFFGFALLGKAANFREICLASSSEISSFKPLSVRLQTPA